MSYASGLPILLILVIVLTATCNKSPALLNDLGRDKIAEAGDKKEAPAVMFVTVEPTQINGAPWTKSATLQLVNNLQSVLLSHKLAAKALTVSESRILIAMDGRDHADEVKELLLSQASVAEVEWERNRYVPKRRVPTPWMPPPRGPAWKYRQEHPVEEHEQENDASHSVDL